MGTRRIAPLVVALSLVVAIAGTASGDGVCVTIDTSRDSLDPAAQAAVRVAILTALEADGVVVDREGVGCTGLITAYSVQLGEGVTTTLLGRGAPVTGKASSLDEVDLLVSQLVRALITGQAWATGTGLQDRRNVLRDQTAPARTHGGRLWTPTIGIGGGMLELPALGDRGRQRQHNIVAIDLREWGFSNARSAFELRLRILIHDYAVLGTSYDRYELARERRERDTSGTLSPSGWALAMIGSPFAAANYEFGIGFAHHLGDAPPRPYVRAGMTGSVLLRLSDPDHRIDLGIGPYVGVGLQFTKHVSLSVEANLQRPIVHDVLDRGYGYFLTTTAMVEVRAAPRLRRIGPTDPIPTIHRIHE